MSATAGASESTHTQDEERSRKVLRMRSIIFVHELNFEKRLIVRPTSAVLKVVDWGIRFPHRPSFAFTRKSIFPSQTRRLGLCDVRGPCDRGWLGSWVGSDTFRMFPRRPSKVFAAKCYATIRFLAELLPPRRVVPRPPVRRKPLLRGARVRGKWHAARGA